MCNFTYDMGYLVKKFKDCKEYHVSYWRFNV